jgi:hypothetical protein
VEFNRYLFLCNWARNRQRWSKRIISRVTYRDYHLHDQCHGSRGRGLRECDRRCNITNYAPNNLSCAYAVH